MVLDSLDCSSPLQLPQIFSRSLGTVPRTPTRIDITVTFELTIKTLFLKDATSKDGGNRWLFPKQKISLLPDDHENVKLTVTIAFFAL